jgi:Domain of unknown function (DUF6285)
MNDRPSAAELIEAVRGFLESELLPALAQGDARLRFTTLVAANVLAIAARELHGEEPMLREEWHALAPLVGAAGEQPERLTELRAEVRAMNERLCESIRGGKFDGERGAALASLLRRTVARKLEVANPRYLQSGRGG